MRVQLYLANAIAHRAIGTGRIVSPRRRRTAVGSQLARPIAFGLRRGEKAHRSPRSFARAWFCRARSTAQYDGSGGQNVRLPYALAAFLERLIGDARLRRALVSTRQSARGAREVHEKRTAFVRLIRSDEGEASLTRAKGGISLRSCTLRLVRFVTERGRRPICAPLGCARREAIGGLCEGRTGGDSRANGARR